MARKKDNETWYGGIARIKNKPDKRFGIAELTDGEYFYTRVDNKSAVKIVDGELEIDYVSYWPSDFSPIILIL